ncbi:hypothetical protein O181_083024 [Austropuccinia psidii MF-1]|uniref:CCHC-type domain-containing protein n=1 Tax=Austropuccinia psidii MF-1 TaxID=1389203 RepID=A0A9Q3ILI1_9BASI|nr:hypothetical protein [Austropuccinia psidii MF-1]
MTDTPTPTFPLRQCGRSKGTLNDLFVAQTKRTDNTEATLDQEYDPHFLWMAIAQVINTITPEMKLKVDGSNFSIWEDNMVMLFNDFLENPKYLTTTAGCTTYGEKLCHSILAHSVSNTICKSIIHIHPCSAIYAHLKSHYHILTYTSQVLLWTNLLSLQMKDEESATALVDRLLSKVCNFKNMHSSFREDHVLGILLQHATHSQPSISNLVMVTSQKKMAIPDKTNLLTFQKLHVADNNSTVEMGNNEFFEGSIDLEALCAMIQGTCHICKQQGHFARNCPKNPRKSQEQNQNTKTFQVYYPILSPSIMQPHATNMAPIHQPQPSSMWPNLYQPQYKSPVVKAWFIEMGAKEPDVTVLSTDIGHTKNFVGNVACY